MRSPSVALTELQESLKAAELLVRLDKTMHKDPPRPGELAGVQGLRGGAAVLMVASFEAFLRAVIAEHLDALVPPRATVDFDKLPQDLQVHSVFETLGHAMRGGRYTVQTPRVQRLVDIEAAATLVTQRVVNPLVFGDTRSNPSPATVKELFKAAGIPDVFFVAKVRFDRKWGQATASTFIRDKLDEIVERRHVVAHTASALNISRSDLGEALRFLRTFGDTLDIELGAHVRQLARTCKIP